MKIEKGLRRFGASLEWFMERIQMRDEEIEALGLNDEVEERENDKVVRAKRMKSIDGVLEEVGVLTDTHFFNEFSETKSSSLFLKKKKPTKM